MKFYKADMRIRFSFFSFLLYMFSIFTLEYVKHYVYISTIISFYRQLQSHIHEIVRVAENITLPQRAHRHYHRTSMLRCIRSIALHLHRLIYYRPFSGSASGLESVPRAHFLQKTAKMDQELQRKTPMK